MSRELKLGLLTLLVLTLGLWGYQYIKGKNILNTVRDYSAVYGNVEGLAVAAPVEINGYPVGSIQSIELNPQDVNTMVVTFEVEGDYQFSQSTKASLSTSNSLVGAKKIVLLFDDLCEGTDCLQDGDRMQSSTRGILETILPKTELQSHLDILREEVGGIADSVMIAAQGSEANSSVAKSIRNLEKSMNNLASLTATMDRFTKSTYSDLETTIANMASITESLERSTDETFNNTNALLGDLKTSVAELNTSFAKVDNILADIENGKGTLGQFMNDEQLYDNLNLLMQDFRLHPKRYVRFSVFGRKGNAYEYPEGDPALEAIDKK